MLHRIEQNLLYAIITKYIAAFTRYFLKGTELEAETSKFCALFFSVPKWLGHPKTADKRQCSSVKDLQVTARRLPRSPFEEIISCKYWTRKKEPSNTNS